MPGLKRLCRLLRGSETISLERQVRICAGAIIFIGCLLSLTFTKWFLIIPIIVGAGLVNQVSQIGVAWVCSWQNCPGTNSFHLNQDK